MIFKKIFFGIILCFMSQIQCMQDQRQLFLRGNELFLQKHYQDAFNVYERINNKGFIVFYNMGICCLRQNKKAETILYIHRAGKQAITYKELTLVEEALEFNEHQEIVSKNWYEKIIICLKKSILIIPILFMQLIVLLGLILLILLWYRRFYKNQNKKFVLFVVLWFSLYFILWYKINCIETKYAVVMESTIPVFAGPDASFYKKSDLNQADLVTIIDQQNQYYKIKLNKCTGWIENNNIELV